MDRRLIIIASTKFKGGAELYIARLAESMSASGVNVRLGGNLNTWPVGLPNDKLRLGPKWGIKRLFEGLLRAPFEVFVVRRYLSANHGATINLHFKREQILFSKIAASYGRVVWTEHGTYPKGPFGRLISSFYKRASRYADEIVCVSDFVRRSIAPQVDCVNKLSIIESAIDVEQYFPATKRPLHCPPVAVVVGRLEPTKRPWLAIKAASDAGCAVLVAGTGRLSKRLTQEFSHDNRVQFLDQVDDVAVLFRTADVHIFCSNGIGEGFPTVLLEAAASGTPTVATNDCGFEKSVMEAGGVVAEATIASLALAIAGSLKEASEKSRQARQWALKRNMSNWSESYRESFFPTDVN